MKSDVLLTLGVLIVAVVACGKDRTPISDPFDAATPTPGTEAIRVHDATPSVLPQPELTPTVVATVFPRPEEMEATITTERTISKVSSPPEEPADLVAKTHRCGRPATT